MSRTDAICASCRQTKYKLSAKKSKLKPDQALLMCDTCIKLRYEPRWIIILTGRMAVADKNMERFLTVREVVKNRRYLGNPILLEDMF